MARPTRPLDWEIRALLWFRSLPGPKRLAIVQALGETTPEGQAFARLTYECGDLSDEEARAKAFEEEGKPALREFWGWFVDKSKDKIK